MTFEQTATKASSCHEIDLNFKVYKSVISATCSCELVNDTDTSHFGLHFQSHSNQSCEHLPPNYFLSKLGGKET